MRHSGGGAGWAALARPAMGLAMSASLGVGGGALLGAALAASVPGVLRPRVAESAILRFILFDIEAFVVCHFTAAARLQGPAKLFSSLEPGCCGCSSIPWRAVRIALSDTAPEA